MYPATIVGIPPMEDFYIGGASVKLFLPIFKMNFPEIVDIALPAEGVFHNLVFVGEHTRLACWFWRLAETLRVARRSVRRDAGHGRRDARAHLQNHARPLEHGPDDVHEIHRGGGRSLRTATNVHNASEVLFHLTASTDPQRDSIFTKGPSDVLDHATSEIASGSKLGIDATKKIPGEGFKRAWPPLIKMDESVKAKVSAGQMRGRPLVFCSCLAERRLR